MGKPTRNLKKKTKKATTKQTQNNKLQVLIELTKPEHAVILGLAVIVSQIITIGALPPMSLMLLGILVPFFIEIGSFAINDLYDIEADKINKRKDKPLATGKITTKEAWIVVAISFPLALILAYMINDSALWIAILFSLISISYAMTLKKWPVIGNVSIAASMAIPFIFGSVTVTSAITYHIIALSTMAFFLGFARELTKSIQDMKGDKKQGRKTLPILIGDKFSAWFAFEFYLTAVIIALMPYFFTEAYNQDPFYIVPIIFAIILVFRSMDHTINLTEFNQVRKDTLWAMLLVLLGFLIGAIL